MFLSIISVRGLRKSYGALNAVDEIDFDVAAGSLFAFLGPNGAGKSTTINILCTILQKDGGEVLIDGHRLGSEDDAVRSTIGVVFQDSVLDELLSVRENLVTRAAFYGLQGEKLNARIQEITESLEMSNFIDRKYGKLSGGQRRRADLARALVNTPKILFLDEPTTGLDPQTRAHVWQMIRKLRKESNVTVFLTTHYMEEAASADDIAIIDNGKIIVRGTPAQLRVDYSKDRLRVIPLDDRFAAYAAQKGYTIRKHAGFVTIDVENSMQALAILKETEQMIENFEVIRGTMDDVFLNVTGKDIRGEEVQQDETGHDAGNKKS